MPTITRSVPTKSDGRQDRLVSQPRHDIEPHAPTNIGSVGTKIHCALIGLVMGLIPREKRRQLVMAVAEARDSWDVPFKPVRRVRLGGTGLDEFFTPW